MGYIQLSVHATHGERHHDISDDASVMGKGCKKIVNIPDTMWPPV